MNPILINLDISFPAFETGVEFLSLVLQRSPPETMNRQSGVYSNSSLQILSLRRMTKVRVLTKFYCEKLDDSETVKPALNGILTLVSLPTFSPPEATTVIEG